MKIFNSIRRARLYGAALQTALREVKDATRMVLGLMRDTKGEAERLRAIAQEPTLLMYHALRVLETIPALVPYGHEQLVEAAVPAAQRFIAEVCAEYEMVATMMEGYAAAGTRPDKLHYAEAQHEVRTWLRPEFEERVAEILSQLRATNFVKTEHRGEAS